MWDPTAGTTVTPSAVSNLPGDSLITIFGSSHVELILKPVF